MHRWQHKSLAYPPQNTIWFHAPSEHPRGLVRIEDRETGAAVEIEPATLERFIAQYVREERIWALEFTTSDEELLLGRRLK